MAAYYNEIDPDACAVLRQCIADGLIAPGDVDSRSIVDVQTEDLRGYTQAHFFAGGGLWSVAARLAGWPDDKPLWTGSCPCQSFSVAGKRLGTDDPRHLWPHLFRLFRECRARGYGPPVLVGEQVSGKAGYGWLDGVRADLATEGYACRARDIPACAVDAPHKRNRLYWIAVEHAASVGRGEGRSEHGFRGRWPAAASADAPGALADSRCKLGRARSGDAGNGPVGADIHEQGVPQVDAFGSGLEGQCGYVDGVGQPGRIGSQQDGPLATTDDRDGSGALAYGDGKPSQARNAGPISRRSEPERPTVESQRRDDCGRYGNVADMHQPVVQGQSPAGQQPRDQPHERIGRRNGTFWSDAEWIVCHDGKARRAKSGIRDVADGIPGRDDPVDPQGASGEEPLSYRLLVPSFKGRIPAWRIAGNAIVPQLAAEVLRAYLDIEGLNG